MWLALKQMLGPRLWMTTLTLVFTWMVAAFVYYGGGLLLVAAFVKAGSVCMRLIDLLAAVVPAVEQGFLAG